MPPSLSSSLACVALLATLSGCHSRAQSRLPAEPPPPIFTDVTDASGLHFSFRNGQEADQFAILESVGGGVGLIDFDNDGLLDVFVTGGGKFDGRILHGYPNRLFRNEGNWRFRDVTAAVGLPVEGLFYTHGVAVADYDNDGWADVLLTGYGRMALYHNEPDGRGGRRFIDVTATAGLMDKRQIHWSASAGWGDLNGDGRPDLFVVHYVDWSPTHHPLCPGYRPDVKRDVCSPKSFAGLAAALYVNLGQGRFREVGADAGIKAGKGLGVLLADLDGDGHLDVYVANDTSGNFLYLNQGKGRFVEAGVAGGVAFDGYGQVNGSMGVDAGDDTGSGQLSLFVTNYQDEAHALYRNLGKGLFQHVSHQAGIAAIGLNYVGFGTGFVDWDRDGWEDLVISNGHVLRHVQARSPVQQRPVLLRNQGGEKGRTTYRNVSDEGGEYFRGRHAGRGLALGDLDNDGRVDVVISHLNEPVRLLRNTLDNGQHWVGVTLCGKENRDAVGARVTLQANGRTRVRVVKGGGSYLSAGDRRIVFGLGAENVEKTATLSLTVQWPSGRKERWKDVQLDRYTQLTEGSGE